MPASDGPPLKLVRLTPPGRAAIATLLVEGPGAAEAVAAQLDSKTPRPGNLTPADRLAFGRFGSPNGEEVVVRFRTAQSVEIHCHGGRSAIARIETLLMPKGARSVSWQDWAAAEHDDPIAAHARIALAEARTERTARILLDQFAGALGRAVQQILALLGRREIAAAAAQLEALLAYAELGRHLVEPWSVVLCGRPNVGKSSLINALVGYQRAIVHPLAGTTRDVVTAATAIDGWPIELADTAGLRREGHPLEQAGIDLATQKMAAADLIILVSDATQAWSEDDETLLRSWTNAILVHNKADLAPCRASRPPGLSTSALTGEGIGELAASIGRRLVPHPPPWGTPVPFTAEQVELLLAAHRAASRQDLATATRALSTIVGGKGGCSIGA